MRRTLGHYALLVMAVVFGVEFILFFGAALTNAGRAHADAVRFLVLAIATFLTFVASLAMFVRAVSHPGLCFAGLLFLQLGANALSTLVAQGTAEHLLRDAIATLMGGVLLWAARVSRRQDGEARELQK